MAGKIYENGALGGLSSDGGERNPGGGDILPEARGGMGQYIYIYIYICSVPRKNARQCFASFFTFTFPASEKLGKTVKLNRC